MSMQTADLAKTAWVATRERHTLGDIAAAETRADTEIVFPEPQPDPIHAEHQAWIGRLVYAMFERDEGQVRVYEITGYSPGHSNFDLRDIATAATRCLHVSAVAQLAPLGGQIAGAGQCVDLGRDRQGRVLSTWISEDVWRERWYEISLNDGSLVTVRGRDVHLTLEQGWLFRRGIRVDDAHRPVIVEVEQRGDDGKWYREHIGFDVVADYEPDTLTAHAERRAGDVADEDGRAARVNVSVPLQPKRYGYGTAASRVLAGRR